MAFPVRKRRQIGQLAFVLLWLRTRRSGVQVPPGAPLFSVKTLFLQCRRPAACLPRADCPSSVRVLGKPSPKVESGMNFQAYCFVCEKRVSALTILDKEGLWKALDSGADVEVIHTGVRGTEGRVYR